MSSVEDLFQTCKSMLNGLNTLIGEVQDLEGIEGMRAGELHGEVLEYLQDAEDNLDTAASKLGRLARVTR